MLQRVCVCVNNGKDTQAAAAAFAISLSAAHSWLFTFSSDTACQTSPQDIPPSKKGQKNNLHNPTTLRQPASLREAATREQRREKTEAVATAS